MPAPQRLMLVAGARPNFMKIAPVMRAIACDSRFDACLVHTGQHYDSGMSDVFFEDLGIPAPNYHLSVGSGSHAVQTAAIMTSFEPVLEAERPACVMVFGDVNSTLACSIVAKKMDTPVAHVEAGLRSGDWSMPEEINRIVTDAVTDFFFVTEPSGVENLLHEGKVTDKVFHVGHVMIDNLLYEVEKLRTAGRDGARISESAALKQKLVSYGVVTLHRPSNVDSRDALSRIVGALGEIAQRLPLIFPCHPRTRDRLETFDLEIPGDVHLLEPLGYQDFLNLWSDAQLVLTDSGGLQEETTGLGIPCMTLRENTERPITVNEGTNTLVGTNPEIIVQVANTVLSRRRDIGDVRRPELWDGRASERILAALANEL